MEEDDDIKESLTSLNNQADVLLQEENEFTATKDEEVDIGASSRDYMQR